MTSGTSVPGLAVPGLAVPGSGGGGSGPLAVDAFTLAFVTGDSTAAGQAFAPAGWTTLPAVTASNGVDHTCDVVLTAAWTVTSAAVSVSGTATSAEDLSGSIIGVQVDAASPIPLDSGVAPGWAGRTILEAAIGSGFQTPPDQMTWTVLNDSALTPAEEDKCFWSWTETSTGIPYALGQLQSSEGSVQLDNAPGNFTPSNPAGSYFPDITTGTPFRLRIALGTVGGVAQDRWYIWQRNATDFTEARDEEQRSYVTAGLTDSWSVNSAPCPTPYRGEVIQDAPQSWWPMDDQPRTGGVLPTQLLNAAAGNSSTLNVYAASGGAGAGDAYTTTGVDATTTGGSGGIIPPGVATYSAGALQGWMPGDPQSSPSASATGNPVTASPGSAAWQQSGGLGSGGANGWFLAANDSTFPPLAAGMSFAFWFNAAFFGSAAGWHGQVSGLNYCLCGQPYGTITLAELATDSAPVAILSLDASGHLILTTYNGATGTPHTIYSGSDLRSASWHQVVITTNGSAWTVYVNGGLTALATGTGAGMTSAWTWAAFNADFGTGGGSSVPAGHHSGNAAYSHAEVYPQILPAWRVLAHYSAAITGFGQLPAPQSVSVAGVINEGGTAYTPDGSLYQGSYGAGVTPYSFSALAVAQAGAYTSGPSARAVTAGVGMDTGGIFYAAAVWAGWTALAPQVTVYTAAAADAETSAAVACGSGDSFSSGFGASAVDAGVCSAGGGSGAAPPAAATPLGDTVEQRIERVLAYGGMTYPGRAIDATATELVQAALDVGGQACGASVQAVVSSDYGMLFVDSGNTISYRARPHLNADTVTWFLSSAGPEYGIPFQAGMEFGNDPQFVTNVIQIAQYSPDGASLPLITPADAATSAASQRQYGPKPLSAGTTSYLQDAGKIQAAANWVLATYGALERRVLTLKVDAASYPPAWPYVVSASVSDLVQVTDQPLSGGPLSAGIYRISHMSKKMSGESNGGHTEASLTIIADPIPPGGYFT